MNVDDLTTVHTEFDKMLGHLGRVVIGGGAVRDALMRVVPKDIDVFVLGGDGDKVKEVLDQQEGYADELVNPSGFVLKTLVWRNIPVQVMVHEASTIGELLHSFDWSVCLFAFDGEVHSWTDTKNIVKDGTLKLHNVRRAASSLRRGYRFSERYGMHITDADLTRLCLAVLLEKQGGIIE